MSRPRILSDSERIERHREACQKWNREHPNRDNGNATRRPEQWRAQLQAERIPLAEFCETCPEDDIRRATQRHHPDYNFPKIFISCCASCHHFIEKGVD